MKPNSTHKPKKLNNLEGFAQAESSKNIARSFCQAILIMNEENNDHEKFFFLAIETDMEGGPIILITMHLIETYY